MFLSGVPCSLAHGGAQVVIDKMLEYLPCHGVEAEPLRWWDPDQRGDILHYVGLIPTGLMRMAHAKGMKVVLTMFLDKTSNRTKRELFVRRHGIKLVERAGKFLKRPSPSAPFRETDGIIWVNRHEQGVATYLYGADPARAHYIDHGLDDIALERLVAPAESVEKPYIASAATIVARKNTIGLAKAAIRAQVPVHFVGKPLADSDPYYAKFRELIDDKYVIYRGFVSEEEKVEILRDAKGFALLSEYESGCIAVYEAAAAGLPLLLSDMPWATKHYPKSDRLRYVDPHDEAGCAKQLKALFDELSRNGEHTFPVGSWRDIAADYTKVYRTVLGEKS